MKIAALYDIHGNLPALEAVLLELHRVDLVLVGGDVVWGPWPRETMEALQTLPNVAFITGNTDRDVCDRAEGRWKQVNDWCADRLSAKQLAFLRSRPATFAADGILFCHGSPRRDTDKITVGTPDERIAGWCAGVAESTVVCGHTHAQFERHVRPWRIVNPGSVGNPTIRATAWWAVLDGGRVELQTTDYDTRATAAAWRATGFPRADFADELLEPYSLERLMERIP